MLGEPTGEPPTASIALARARITNEWKVAFLETRHPAHPQRLESRVLVPAEMGMTDIGVAGLDRERACNVVANDDLGIEQDTASETKPVLCLQIVAIARLVRDAVRSEPVSRHNYVLPPQIHGIPQKITRNRWPHRRVMATFRPFAELTEALLTRTLPVAITEPAQSGASEGAAAALPKRCVTSFRIHGVFISHVVCAGMSRLVPLSSATLKNRSQGWWSPKDGKRKSGF